MTNRLAEQIADKREQLQATREALGTDKQYRMARPEMIEPLLLEAESYIGQAERIFKRNPNPKLTGDPSTAFKACLRVAYLNMILALRDPAVTLGTERWLHLKKSGKKGADARHGDSSVINDLYARYARKRDGLGSLTRPTDIYNSFFGDCEAAEIEPPILKTFRNRLALKREELGLK